MGHRKRPPTLTAARDSCAGSTLCFRRPGRRGFVGGQGTPYTHTFGSTERDVDRMIGDDLLNVAEGGDLSGDGDLSSVVDPRRCPTGIASESSSSFSVSFRSPTPLRRQYVQRSCLCCPACPSGSGGRNPAWGVEKRALRRQPSSAAVAPYAASPAEGRGFETRRPLRFPEIGVRRPEAVTR
jgi:hypothetical protein